LDRQKKFGLNHLKSSGTNYNRLVREPGWFPHKSAFFQAEALQKCDFYKEVVQKLKFPNNSNKNKDLYGGRAIARPSVTSPLNISVRA
jgi:hypothetical protein